MVEIDYALPSRGSSMPARLFYHPKAARATNRAPRMLQLLRAASGLGCAKTLTCCGAVECCSQASGVFFFSREAHLSALTNAEAQKSRKLNDSYTFRARLTSCLYATMCRAEGDLEGVLE
jgi:hypothetical protein